MARFIGLVENHRLWMDMEDTRWWTLDRNGKFSVKSCMSIYGDGDMGNHSGRALWSLKALSKVLFLLWLTCRNWLPTIDNLQKRGMCIPDACFFCYQATEDASHILIHCP